MHEINLNKWHYWIVVGEFVEVSPSLNKVYRIVTYRIVSWKDLKQYTANKYCIAVVQSLKDSAIYPQDKSAIYSQNNYAWYRIVRLLANKRTILYHSYFASISYIVRFLYHENISGGTDDFSFLYKNIILIRVRENPRYCSIWRLLSAQNSSAIKLQMLSLLNEI